MNKKLTYEDLLGLFGMSPAQAKPTAKPDTYVVPYRCGNCGTIANVRFKQGVVAPDGAIKCPRCGTRRTRKVV